MIFQYKYLEVLSAEHLDIMQMAKIVTQSASRAGGIPFECFTQCYGATVQSITDYTANVVQQFGTRDLCLVLALFKNALAVIPWDY